MICGYVSWEVQFLAVTVTKAAFKTLGFYRDVWSSACISDSELANFVGRFSLKCPPPVRKK